ncbi:DUF433 domain-containing protein [Paractinoplanes brasiliensis]|uniref:Uncharacterized protein (DUF433 family) n=1 Tax=Paractinoplanes brasiliensis TaxID=52695 RepID=A0A4V3C842_9ACTN|nr:DUF433 domain-containing protein [Actinoplanes brasiliensis]TDO39618.1 uncharacterized protein (DUF433 family) [Actinoplanes brasiliensis]GID29043.1 hypothetical protein Abr02nite_40260 [Actinoplanes brasiliensis]
MAYEPRIASALSGATRSQLDYWRREELLVPEVSATRPLLYSFRDLIALRTFVYLRESRPLQTIRKAMNSLRDIGETEHLSKYRFVTQGRRGIALVQSSGEGAVELVERPGHQLTVLALGDVLRSFPLDSIEVPNLAHPRPKLSVNPAVRRGYPVVAGTRVGYDLVAGLVRDGVSPAEIKEYYPGVSAEAARDAVSFADYVDRAAGRTAA